MSEALPVDIQTGKLLDWLLRRRHISSDWSKNVLVVRQKIGAAIQDMPEHPEIARLLAGSYINYFHCLQIIEVLRETEKDTRNMFGYYSSQRMKDWQEITKLYQKEKMFLADACQLLIRNVNYEIPALKKSIAKCDQVIEECERKIHEWHRAAGVARSKYESECASLGIIPLTGGVEEDPELKKTMGQLVALLDQELPGLYRKLQEDILLLKFGRKYYESFVAFTLPNGIPPEGVLPLLNHVIEKGNTSTYEWTYGEAPLRVERSLEATTSVEKTSLSPTGSNSEEIDFGDDSSPPVMIGEDGENGGSAIDWGDDNGASIIEGFECISTSVSGDGDVITVEASGVEGGVAQGADALSILENPSTRTILLDEILELEAFLQHRLLESKSLESVLTLSLFQNAPTELQMVNPDNLSDILQGIQTVLKTFHSSKLQHLMRLSASPRYVHRLAENLHNKLKVVQRHHRMREEMEEKRSLVSKEQAALTPQLRLLIDKSKDLQNQIEVELAKLCHGRKVHLMGGVSTL